MRPALSAIDNCGITRDNSPMWLSGRRAVRPDREYYRDVRRARMRSGERWRHIPIGGPVVVALVIGAVLMIWMISRLAP